MELPSKELLGEVLCINVQTIDIDFISKSFSGSVLRYYSDSKDYLINIYELAHMCKEWAFTQGYRLSSQYVPKGKYTSSWCKVHELVSEDNKFIVKYNSDTEPEAIFRACQWVLDNKDR